MRGFDVLNPTLNVLQSYFLEASAGTGKTFAIENIVARLVQAGLRLDQILVVTFTRAATVELKERIRHRLKEKLRIQFDDAKIFTIHSFCFHTLKEHALETGFNLKQTEESASSDVLKRIFKDFFRADLTANVIHPKQLEKVIRSNFYDIEKLLQKISSPLSELPGREYHEIMRDIKEEIALLSFRGAELLELLRGFTANFKELCDIHKNIKPEIEEGLIRTICFFEGKTEDAIDLPLIKMVPEKLKSKKVYPELLQTLNRRLIPLLEEISDTKLIFNLLHYKAKQFLARVQEKEDLFFYDDLLTLMQENAHRPAFAQKIRENYKAVLVDEFQDTDKIQWDIFSTLFLGHCPLYLVGDPKQSIYRFRGADLYVYMEAMATLGQQAHATLNRNFRSSPPLIYALNSLFNRTPTLITLPKTGQCLELPPIIPGKEGIDKGGIIFCPAETEEALFSAIVTEIERLHQEEAVPYRECAVLVKDRYQASRFCARCPLPYVTRRSESLADSDAFSVLEDILMAAYNPRERHFVTKALGGPFFRIPLESLVESLEKGAERFFRYHHLLMSEGILPFFHALVDESELLPENLYADLLQLTEMIAQEASHLEEYLPALRKLRAEDPESDKLKARARNEEDAIQIMTIHVSKGLEFEAVFPIGLICTFDMQDPEDKSEKMRQLYVAMTRAKTFLYVPVCGKENSPMHLFLSQVLQGEPLEVFVQNHPHFSFLKPWKAPSLSQQPPTLLSFETHLPLNFPPLEMYSYSSLAAKKEHISFLPIPDEEMPAGSETGLVLHRIFEKLPFEAIEELPRYVKSELKGTHLENWEEGIVRLVRNTLEYPLPTPEGSFCLRDVNPACIWKEIEFVYPSKEPEGYLKGFIDLFFEYQGGYYIVDWKSNWLAEYSQTGLQEAIQSHDYSLQASIYQEAITRYLSLFQKQGSYKGAIYLFLRGLDPQKQLGAWFFNAK